LNRIATSWIILVQLWLLAPVCCCWFQAAVTTIGAGSCCCSQSDEGMLGQTAPLSDKDRNCRCSENKIELPPQPVVVRDLTSQRLTVELPLFAPSRVALSVVDDPSGPQDLRERPPPLSAAERLSSLHRLNL
jgi:hypothetical protein